MRLTILGIRLPEGIWSGDTSRAHPDALLLVEGHMPTQPPCGVVLVRIRSADIQGVLDEVQRHPTVRRLEVIEREDGEALVKVDTCKAALLGAAVRVGIVPEPPVVIQGGEATWRILGQQDDIQPLREVLADAGLEAVVRFVGEFSPPDELTEKQRRVLRTAVREGFYDYPRRITLTNLSKKLGVSGSTLSESLMVVEKKVIHHFMDAETTGTAGRITGRR